MLISFPFFTDAEPDLIYLSTGAIQRQSESEDLEDEVKSVQTKLTVGAPGDKYEQEADSVAAQVMSMSVQPAPSMPIQRQGEEEEQEPLVQRSSLADSITPLVQRLREEQEEPLQAKSLLQRAGNGNALAGSNVENQLTGSKGGGSPLPNEVRSFMEPRFGADFSSVRVHTDSTAVQMNKELGAQAFAHGSDIYYGAGKSPGKNELTAHELTHVVQQTGAKKLQTKPLTSWPLNKEMGQTKISAAPSLDSPPKTALQLKENSAPQIEGTNSSDLVQKAPAAAPPTQSEQGGQPTNANAQESEGGGGIFEVKKIIDKLQEVLSGAGGVIWSIAKDPVGFLGNLVAGLRQGFDNFLANAGTHLQAGLIGWLTGTLGSMGVQIPEDIFSLKGIFGLAAQVLGLTWNYIRSKAVKQFGEPTVARMEKGSEIFQMLAAKGPMGMWEHVQGEFGDLKETVIGEIKNMVITQVITAGVKWVVSMLNPASGLVRAAIAIYDIVIFFVNRGSQVVELVNAVIGSVKAIASGAVGNAAKLVESALARSVPVLIGFMASLLGIGGLAKRVQGIVGKVRDRIDKAIDKVLLKAKSLFKGEKGKDNKEGKDTKEDKVSEEEGPEHDLKVKAGLAQIEQEQARYLKDDAIAKEDAEKVAAKVKAENPVFKSITVADNKETWDYIYVASPVRNKKGPKQANSENNNLTEDEKRIASILKESGYSQDDAKKLSKKNHKKISELKPEIKEKSSRLLTFLDAYISELPKKIEDLDEEGDKQREILEKIITQTNDEFDKLANQSGIKNAPISILIEILGSNDYLKYKRLYFEYQKKKQAYEKQKQDAKDEPQAKEPEALENPVKETQRPDIPMNILKRYGYHWDVARDALAYTNGKKRGKARRDQMKTLVDFRSTVVLKVLKDAMRKVGSQIPGAEVGEFTHNSMGATLRINAPIGEQPEKGKEKIAIKAIAPGSSNLTSDYDVTFQIEQLPQHEADLVREFNQVFRNYFVSLGGPGYESGLVFDTNAYTSGFLGQKGALYKPKTEEASDRLALQQLTFSLVAILKGLPQEQWEHFEGEVIKEATDILRLNSDGVEVIKELFKEAKTYTTTTSEAIDEQKKDVMKNYSENLKIENEGENSPSKETTSKPNKVIEVAAQMHAANRLYERQIEKVSGLIKKYKEADKEYNPKAVEAEEQKKAKEKANEIDNISIELYQEQSLALIYANEAYYSAGPVLHIVGEMQMGLGKISTKVEYLQSLLVQIGYKLQHIQHYEHLFHDVSNERQKARKLDRVGLLFAKYGYRAIEALNELSSSFEEAGVVFELSEKSAKSIVADLEMEFIKKAGDGTPQEKVSQAVKAGGVVSKDLRKGQNLDLKVMQSSWKELAIKVLARIPHLLNDKKSK